MEIPLTQGQFAIVDEADYAWLSQWKWHAQWNRSAQYFVAARHTPRPEHKAVYMHRQVLGLSFDNRNLCDHINGNSLDNRRANLRVATHTQNMHNKRTYKTSSTGIKGLTFLAFKKTNPWVAIVHKDSKRYHLGYFATKDEAISSLNKTRDELHGEYARRI